MSRRVLFLSLSVMTAALVVAATMASFALPPAQAQSNVRNEATWMANGVVRTIVPAGAVTYLGGDFTAIGPYMGRGASLDASGTPAMNFPKTNSTINAVAADGYGGWYVGGAFTIIGGILRNRIAHITAGGTVDPAWDPNSNSTVSALAIAGGTLYAGGSFTAIGGQSRNYIAALSTATGNATGWNPNATASTAVSALALSADAGTVYAGGTFTTMGGIARNRIAALSAATGLVTTWNANANSTVSALAVTPTAIYAGGSFTTIGGLARTYIAAMDPTTGTPTDWDAAANNTVVALAVSGNAVYAGGTFTTIGGQTRNRIAALDATINTGMATAWNPNASTTVSTLAMSADAATVYAGGSFVTIGGQTRNYIAGLSVATGLATAWDPNANAAVLALAVNGTNVYAGGSFNSIGRYNRNRLAALDTATGAATSWNPNASASVYAIALSADASTVYAGGTFITMGGIARSRIAAISAASGATTAWNPTASSTVNALAVSGTTVYAGGAFATIGGQTRNRIAALDSTIMTNMATAWNPNANSTVSALAVSGSTVYAGGAFTNIGGQTRNYIAALNATVFTNNATAWNPVGNAAVNALALSPDSATVYTGGAFTSMGGQTRNYIAALDASVSTNNATAWDPNANATVTALAVSSGTVYAGGNFTSIGGQWKNFLAALSAATGTADAFEPNPNVGILAIGVGTRVYAGGSFTTVGALECTYFAEFQYLAPSVTGINPATATRGQTLTGVSITGTEFRDVAMTVQLQRAGEIINGTGVTWVSPMQVTADFAIPADATVAIDWAVFLQHNDDSRSSTLGNAFTVTYPGPVLSGMSPATGECGQTLTGVTISGSAFRDTPMTVSLTRGAETIPATSVTWVSANTVNADFAIPAGATVASDWSLYLQHNDDGKSYTLANAFSVTYPPPQVLSIAPDNGRNNSLVHVTNLAGAGFRPGAAVRLQKVDQADIIATAVSVVSANKITCDMDLTGAATGAWDVRVTNSDARTAVLPGGFTVTYPAPSVVSIAPVAGNNDGVVHITNLAGAGFRAGASVKLMKTGQVDIAATAVTVVSPALITCELDLTGKATGFWDVVVTNDDAASGMLASGFDVQYPPPVLSGMSPATGERGQTLTGVTVSGSAFRNTPMTVSLTRGSQTIAAGNITWVSATSVNADFSIPADAVVASDWSLYLRHNDDGKSSTLTNAFTITYPAPRVLSIAPDTGNNDGVAHITNLAGTGFRAGATMRLKKTGETDIVASSVVVVTANKITCDLDLTGAAPGAWDVRVTNSDDKSDTLAGAFTITYPAPRVLSIAPDTGNNDAPVHVSDLAGSAFRSGATVKLRKAGQTDIDATSAVVVSPTRITCDLDITGKATGAWDVVVTNDDARSDALTGGFDVQYPPPVLSGMSPATGERGQTITGVTISGSAFRDTPMTVSLRRGAETIPASNITWVSATSVNADFAIPTGATAASDWSLYLRHNDDGKSSTLASAFSVTYPPPQVLSIAPDTGNNDGVAHITNLAGTGFRAGAAVRLKKTGESDIIATSVSVVSPNRITCDLELTGAATGPWDVRVTNSDGKSDTLAGAFTVQSQGPTVTGITPAFANNDDVVHISDLAGTWFRAGATVKLRKTGQTDLDATSVVVASPAQITCDIDLRGAAAGAWSVVVTNDDTLHGTLPDGFDVQYPPPVLSDMSPATGERGQTLTGVTITGSAFRDAPMTVSLTRGAETIAASNISWVSAATVRADFSLPTDATVASDWSLYLRYNDDGKSSTLTSAFTVTYPPPQVLSIAPDSGNNDGVIHIANLAGAGLRTGAAVRLHKDGQTDVTASSVIVVSANRITCDIDLTGAATGAWDVRVTNSDAKSDTLAGAFNVQYQGPTVTAITPVAANNDAPVQVSNLAGSAFRSGATVKLRKAGQTDVDATSVVIVSPARICCDVDITGAATGTWDVVVTNDDGKSATLPDGFDVQYPAPQLSGMSPTSGDQGELLNNVQISGYNFRDVSTTVKLIKGSEEIWGTNIVWNGPSEISCRIDLTEVRAGAGWSLCVAHNDDGKCCTLAHIFTVKPAPPAPPVVDGISPASGIPGQALTVTGTNFGYNRGDSVVTVNGVAASDYPSWTNTKVVLIVPEGATTGPVVVRTELGGSNSNNLFTLTYPAWYLAEGSTDHGFSTRISIENPNKSSSNARVTYMKSDGAIKQVECGLPAMSQVTLDPADSIGKADFSTKVECLQGKTIAVDRTMTWTGPGAASPEGHSSIGVTSPVKAWYLAEGCSAYGFETWLLVQNPNDTAATVTITYMPEGWGPQTFVKKVPACSRATFSMADDIGQKSSSIKVESSVPVIAERSVYRNNRREGSCSTGTTNSSVQYYAAGTTGRPEGTAYLPEGTTGHGFTTYVLIQNPNESAATVKVTYLTPDGPQPQPAIQMPALSRKTVRVNDALRDTDFSTHIASDVPVVAERAMYWDNGTGEACHASIGLAAPHSSFYLPDGQTSGGHETFILIANPGAKPVDVDVTYLTAQGAYNVNFTTRVPANSRATLNMGDRIPSGRAAALVTCRTRGMKILVERAMYWNNRGAGTSTIGGFSD
jgi:hypothetical protein